jgi:hypothetical protein
MGTRGGVKGRKGKERRSRGEQEKGRRGGVKGRRRREREEKKDKRRRRG